jgi:hypothetical protein
MKLKRATKRMRESGASSVTTLARSAGLWEAPCEDPFEG